MGGENSPWDPVQLAMPPVPLSPCSPTGGAPFQIHLIGPRKCVAAWTMSPGSHLLCWRYAARSSAQVHARTGTLDRIWRWKSWTPALEITDTPNIVSVYMRRKLFFAGGRVLHSSGHIMQAWHFNGTTCLEILGYMSCPVRIPLSPTHSVMCLGGASANRLGDKCCSIFPRNKATLNHIHLLSASGVRPRKVPKARS